MVKVLLFAKLRDITGLPELIIYSDSLQSCIIKFSQMYPDIKEELHKCIYVLNQKQIDDLNTSLVDTDILAIIPPVSGG